MLHFTQRLSEGAVDPSRKLDASVAPSASSSLLSLIVEVLPPLRPPAALLIAVDSRLPAAFAG